MKEMTGKHMRRLLTAVLAVLLGAAMALAAGATQEEVTAEKQYERARDSLLYIRSYYASGGLKATGSGFVVTADGLAVTAAHVIDKGARITALMPDGRELETSVVSCDAVTDVAVLRLPEGKYPALALSKTAPAGGAPLRAMGYPIKDTAIITEGLLSAPSASVSDKRRMLVTCDIVNGMSGGPLFDRYGKVVGMASGSVRTMSGIHLSAQWSDLDAAVTAAQSGK